MDIINDDILKSILKPRDPLGNKYTNGRVLVIAGSEKYPGAAMLSVESALRSGAGLVTAATPASISDMVSVRCPEALRIKLGKNDEFLNLAHLDTLVDASKKATSVVIGPGIGRNPETITFVKEFLRNTLCKKIVVDADALFAICGEYEIFRNLDAIVTPHEMEAARLLSEDVSFVTENRLESARKLHELYNCISVLKGPGTITLADNDSYTINTTGNSSLSKGGTGDVLAGLMGGILASGISSYDAARSAVYIHGRAADILSKENSEYTVIPSDLGKAFRI